MKKVILLLTSLICLALSSASLHAALSYWDANGTTAGAGATPDGTWDPTDPGPYSWTADPTGASATNAWIEGDTAVFSAGTDGINAFTVGIIGYPQVGGIIFEEGRPTLSGGGLLMTNEFEFPIVANTNAIIDSFLVPSFTTVGFKKTGPGTVTLGGVNNSLAGTNVVAEGRIAFTTVDALGVNGAGVAPVVVESGAALQQAAALNFASIPHPLILSGTGINNSGAFYATTTINANNQGWSGVVQLHGDTRINLDDSNQWTWITPSYFDGTNGGNNWSLTFGGSGGSTGNGTITLKNTGLANRIMFLGDGSVTKDGPMQLRLEAAAVFNGGFHFNGGKLAVRYPMFGQGPGGVGLGTVYVGAAAQEFNNPNASPNIGNAIVLAPGANPRFNTSGGAANSITCSGVISGLGGLSVTNLGKVILTGASTYSGNTTILGNAAAASGAGTLILNGSGASIANSAVIDVQLNGIFDVSTVTNALGVGKFVLGAAQTLKGNGTVVGNVTANGTLSPGASIGTLTFNNDLTIAGNLVIEVDKTVVPANDSIAVTGLLNNAGVGAVMVKTNGAAALLATDSFTISPAMGNGQALAVFGGGVVWTNELASSGKITVVAAAPVTATNLKVTGLGLNSVTLGATGGAYQGYGVFASTNVSAPMANWTLIGGATANGSGVISFTDTQAMQQQKFYRFGN